jgi:hypothetical protein
LLKRTFQAKLEQLLADAMQCPLAGTAADMMEFIMEFEDVLITWIHGCRYQSLGATAFGNTRPLLAGTLSLRCFARTVYGP